MRYPYVPPRPAELPWSRYVIRQRHNGELLIFEQAGDAHARVQAPVRCSVRRSSVLSANPVRDVQPLRSKSQPKGAVALTANQLRDLLVKIQTSSYCEKHDLIDPITLLVATGLRRSELLGLRWADFDEKAGMLAVTGKVIRVTGQGLMRVDETKSTAGRRTLPLPKFAIEMLQERRHLPYLGGQEVIFRSTAGTLRDPNISPRNGARHVTNSALRTPPLTASARLSPH